METDWYLPREHVAVLAWLRTIRDGAGVMQGRAYQLSGHFTSATQHGTYVRAWITESVMPAAEVDFTPLFDGAFDPWPRLLPAPTDLEPAIATQGH